MFGFVFRLEIVVLSYGRDYVCWYILELRFVVEFWKWVIWGLFGYGIFGVWY